MKPVQIDKPQLMRTARYISRRIRACGETSTEIPIRPSAYKKHKLIIDNLKSVRVSSKRGTKASRVMYFIHFKPDKTVNELQRLVNKHIGKVKLAINGRKLREYHQRKRERLYGEYSDAELEARREKIRREYLDNIQEGRIIDIPLERKLYAEEARLIDELRMRAGHPPIYLFEN